MKSEAFAGLTRNPKIAVIGGGASGLFAAVCAAKEAKRLQKTIEICVFDANSSPARKILVSGNGRCNLTNSNVSAENYYNLDPRFFNGVYSQFRSADMISFLAEYGFMTHEDHAGRIYPLGNQAAGVKELLLALCSMYSVVLYTDSKIHSVSRSKNGYLLNGSYFADRVIFACGSAAAHRNGGMDSLHLLSNFGVQVKPFLPALTGLRIKGFSKYQLKGVRADGSVQLIADKKKIASDRGELQYTEYGVSGIPAMQISCEAARLQAEGRQIILEIDSLPDYGKDEFIQLVINCASSNATLPLNVFLNGLFPMRLSAFFLKKAEVPERLLLGDLNEKQMKRLAALIKSMQFPMEAVCGLPDAQVASGGVSLRELDPQTLELHKLKGCYVCGEMMDCCGACGGYNLQWAWSSGFVAGIHAAREI